MRGRITSDEAADRLTRYPCPRRQPVHPVGTVLPANGFADRPTVLRRLGQRRLGNVTGLRTLDRAVGLGPGDHASWAYDDVADLQSACVDYFTDGLSRGERLMYVGARSVGALVDDLADLPRRDRLLEDGALTIHTLGDHLRTPGALVPEVQLEARRQIARDAIAAGYSGLRVVGDITEFVVRPDLIDSLVEFELVVDTAMSTTAVTTLCALDRQRAAEHWRQVSALHAIQHLPGRNAGFALQKSESALSLVGEIDIASAKDLDVLLDHLLRTTSGDLTFELSDLDFIDVAGTRRLALFRRTMAASGRSLIFRRLSPAARRTFKVFALVEADER